LAYRLPPNNVNAAIRLEHMYLRAYRLAGRHSLSLFSASATARGAGVQLNARTTEASSTPQ
jgi:hypothetical protein